MILNSSSLLVLKKARKWTLTMKDGNYCTLHGNTLAEALKSGGFYETLCTEILSLYEVNKIN